MTAKTTRKRTAKPKVIKVAKLPELPLKPFAFEVFDLASNQRSKVKKIEVLKKYEDLSLKQLFKWNFDSTIVSVLPEGEVPYQVMMIKQHTAEH